MGHLFYIPDILQYDDYDCGIACVQVVLAYYGIDTIESKLLKKMKPDKNYGASFQQMATYLKNSGFKVKLGVLTLKELKSQIRKKKPVIILIQAYAKGNVNYENTYEHGHYVIPNGYDSKNIYFEDPAFFGKAYLPMKIFLKRWHGDDEERLMYYGMIIETKKKPFNFKKRILIT
jgi:predicted double-glycine peptidase